MRGPICIQVELKGISLRFLRSFDDGRNLDDLSPNAIKKVVEGMGYSNGTQLGTILRDRIVKPMVLETKREKPLIVVIITDGEESKRSQLCK